MSEPISTEQNVGHEITIWRARPFVIGVTSFFVFMTFVFVVIGACTLSWSRSTWPPHHAPASPGNDGQWTKSAPQLQVNPAMDLTAVQKVEYQRLHSLRWVDETHTYAIIPIDQALTLLAQADANHQLKQLLPPPLAATPIELQRQKSGAASFPPPAP